MSLTASLRRALRRLWCADAPLTFVGVGMLVVLLPSLAGLALDPRTITGAPAWLKPAKFAVSAGVYSLTLAWVVSWLPDWPRTRRVVSWTTAVVMVLEVAIIDLQAWRGTTSHFNVATPLDATLFGVMGTGIAVQTAASALVALALWKQPFVNRAFGLALRAGMVITLLGAASGGLMTAPTSAQLAAVRSTHTLATSGAHTVGAPDGGPGLPGTGWSRDHGDLRIPHFVGLHALQVLPLFALLAARLRSTDAAARVTRVATWSYGVFFALLLRQAWQGEGLLNPGTVTLALFAFWTVASIAAGLVAARDWQAAPRRHEVTA